LQPTKLVSSHAADLKPLLIQLPDGITGIALDSRMVTAGKIFAALPGTQVDGRTFIAQAIAAGARAVLVPRGSNRPAAASGIAWIESNNARRDTALLAAHFAGAQPIAIAAVTGTSGKTSTTLFLKQLWRQSGHTAAVLGTMGLLADGAVRVDTLTTPDPVQLHQLLASIAGDGISHLAMEASSHGLDQARLDGVALTAAAFTNLSREHLDYHPTMAAYLAAKTRLCTELLPADGTAVICTGTQAGDCVLAATRAAGRRVLTITDGVGGDIALTAATPVTSGLAVEARVHGTLTTVQLPLVGRFQAINALTAFALGTLTGGPTNLATALPTLTSIRGRMELVGQTETGAAVYVDYAHKPGALASVLTALRPHIAGQLRVVFGCGGDRDAGKRAEMGEVAARLADRAIVTDDNPRTEDPAGIRAAIMAACPGATEIDDRRAAITAGLDGIGAGDVLLIAGKGHEDYQIVGTDKLPFDDAAIVRGLLGYGQPTIGDAA
jgi:UDP-N-acetylmuramoyl-L-alanyl-D-glutamate--2,6-diaminopimelate ligase